MAQYPARLETRLEEKEREFDLLDQVYPRALARVQGKDEEWEAKKKAIEVKIARSILLYKFDDPPHKAVAILAQLQSECRELLQPQKIVDDWQEVRRELNFLHQEVEKQKETMTRAEKAYTQETDRWRNRAIS